MNEAAKLSREVLKQHHDEAFKWAMSCCNYDYECAREVVQLTYVAILENRARFNGQSSLKTWLFSVIRKTALNHRRQTKLNENHLYRLQKLVNADLANTDLDSAFLFEDDVKRLCFALDRLTHQQRQIIELVYYREFTLAEVAQVLCVSIGTARKQFHRAKEQLARRLIALKN